MIRLSLAKTLTLSSPFFLRMHRHPLPLPGWVTPRGPPENEGQCGCFCLCQWVVAKALLVWNDYAIAKEEHERAYVSEQVGQALRGY